MEKIMTADYLNKCLELHWVDCETEVFQSPKENEHEIREKYSKEAIKLINQFKDQICNKQKEDCVDYVMENCESNPTFGEIEDKILATPIPK